MENETNIDELDNHAEFDRIIEELYADANRQLKEFLAFDYADDPESTDAR